MPRVAVVAHHVRSGVSALNVVTGALEADARTAGLDVTFAKGREELVRRIAEARARADRVVVAWSFYSPDFAASRDDLAWVRERVEASSVWHVAGGVHATAEPGPTLRAGFDLAVIGEGEGTFVELVAAHVRGEDPRGHAGVAYLDAEGRLVSHGPGERSPLDRFPPFNVRFGKWNAIEITRGCVYACSFCQTPYAFKARFRHRSVANVRAHVDAMVAEGARFVRFVTPTSLSYGAVGEEPDLGAVESLLASVREAVGAGGKIYFGTFPSEVRPEHVTPRALAVLSRWVDNRSLVIGGQSGSDRVLSLMRRGHTVADVIRAVEVSVAAGFRPDVDVLLGVPGETAVDRLATLELAERLVELGARIHSHAFMPLPGTPLRDAVPEPLGDAARGLAQLEARGAMHGAWRRQQLIATDLVRARRAAGKAPPR